MTKNYTFAVLALGAALLGAWVDASALTLGRVRGAALLGQPLEVTVPLQFGPEEDAAQTCFEVDVFYGENRQESTAIALSSGGQTTSVRIRSRARVDEPVVTIYLKSTCGQKSSRRYVLLADLVSEVASSHASLDALRVPLVMEPPKVVAPANTADASSQNATIAMGAKVEPKAKRRAVAAPAPAVARVAKPPGQLAEVSRKPRLKLAPLDMSAERAPMLRATNELLSAPVEDMQKRAEALAMWRALNASPQDVLRDEARIQAMESDVKRLSDTTARNLTALQEVTGRLEVAESQRYANPLVYGLVIGLMACLAALVFVWQRLRKSLGSEQPWWGSPVDEPSMLREDLADVQGPLVEATQVPTDDFVATAITKDRKADVEEPSGVDIDLEMGESVFAPAHLPASRAPVSQFMEAQPSATGALRAINTKEMLDVRQQAEFFMTLGQYDDGIALLETSIKGSTESNPLVYLDLLKALHTLSRKMAFEAYRAEFNQVFTGIVPPYARFNQESRGLDAYPDICRQIVALWPAEPAIQFMESCMVRQAGDAPDQGFDLDAFRELLLLHAVAKRLSLATAESGMVPFSAVRSKPGGSGLSFDGTDRMPVATVLPTDAAPAGVLDLNLSEPDPNGNLIDFDISDYALRLDKDITPGDSSGRQ